jgi:hypothetical protein
MLLVRPVLLAVLSAAGLGCAARQAATPQVMPVDAALRRASLSQLGAQLFEGLRSGKLDQSFASMRELDEIVVPSARLRLDRDRTSSIERGSSSLDLFRRDWGAASYVGFCAQGAREEAAGTSLGLTQRGWVLDRILVVARTDDHGLRSASWLEGEFVYTQQGWRALSFHRIETPRRHHADLELAPCDVEAGLR